VNRREPGVRCDYISVSCSQCLLPANPYPNLSNPEAAAERLMKFLSATPDVPPARPARKTPAEIDRILAP